MGRLVDISWPELEISVVAELADEQNPELCEEFWQNLPSRSCRRTQWSRASRSTPGRQSSHRPGPPRERIIDCPIGRMRYSQATRNKFSIQYGKGLEPWPSRCSARCLTNISTFCQGRQGDLENVFWRKEQIFVEVKPHAALRNQAAPRPKNLPAADALLDEPTRFSSSSEGSARSASPA